MKSKQNQSRKAQDNKRNTKIATRPPRRSDRLRAPYNTPGYRQRHSATQDRNIADGRRWRGRHRSSKGGLWRLAQLPLGHQQITTS